MTLRSSRRNSGSARMGSTMARSSGVAPPGRHWRFGLGALGLSVAALVGVHLSDTSDQDAVTMALQRLGDADL